MFLQGCNYNPESDIHYYLSELNTASTIIVSKFKKVLKPKHFGERPVKSELKQHVRNFKFYTKCVLTEFKKDKIPPTRWFISRLSQVYDQCSSVGIKACKKLKREKVAPAKKIIKRLNKRINKIRALPLKHSFQPLKSTPPELDILNHSLPPEKSINLLAVHVEAAGSNLDWPTISIAFSHSLYDPTTGELKRLDRKRFSILTREDQLEPRCKEEYWNKNMEKFIEFQKDAKSYAETARDVVKYVTEKLRLFPDIKILSKNVPLDIARLNSFLEDQGMEAIGNRPDGLFQPPIDFDSVARVVATLTGSQDPWVRDVSNKRLAGFPEFDNDPAYQICCRYAHYNKLLKEFCTRNVTHILGVDIKAAGSQLKYPTVSVGFCHAVYDCATKAFNLLSTERFDIKVSEGEFEPKCFEECWKYRKKAFREMQEHAKPYDEIAPAICNYVKKLVKQHPGMTVVSNNTSFDITRLDEILRSRKLQPISYRPDGEYQLPVNLSDIEWALALIKSSHEASTRHVSSQQLLATLKQKLLSPVKHNRKPDRAAFIAAYHYARCLEELDYYKVPRV